MARRQKGQKRPPKDYFSERIKEAVELNRKAQELLHIIFGEETKVVRRDMFLLKEEEKFLNELKKIEDDLNSILSDEFRLDDALKAKSTDLVRKMCDDLKIKIATVIRELETLRSEEYAVEEKRSTEIKELRTELADTTKLENLIEQLKNLEKKIISMAEKAGVATKAKIRKIKL